MATETIWLFEACAVWYLIGLVWMVQLVHYPLFHIVGEADFTQYAKSHVQKMSWAVVPAMLSEAATGTYLYANSVFLILDHALFALLVTVWFITFAKAVPCHEVLQHKKEAATIDRLLFWNRLRAIAWTARGVIIIYPLLEIAA